MKTILEFILKNHRLSEADEEFNRLKMLFNIPETMRNSFVEYIYDDFYNKIKFNDMYSGMKILGAIAIGFIHDNIKSNSSYHIQLALKLVGLVGYSRFFNLGPDHFKPCDHPYFDEPSTDYGEKGKTILDYITDKWVVDKKNNELFLDLFNFFNDCKVFKNIDINKYLSEI